MVLLWVCNFKRVLGLNVALGAQIPCTCTCSKIAAGWCATSGPHTVGANWGPSTRPTPFPSDARVPNFLASPLSSAHQRLRAGLPTHARAHPKPTTAWPCTQTGPPAAQAQDKPAAVLVDRLDKHGWAPGRGFCRRAAITANAAAVWIQVSKFSVITPCSPLHCSTKWPGMEQQSSWHPDWQPDITSISGISHHHITCLLVQGAGIHSVHVYDSWEKCYLHAGLLVIGKVYTLAGQSILPGRAQWNDQPSNPMQLARTTY